MDDDLQILATTVALCVRDVADQGEDVSVFCVAQVKNGDWVHIPNIFSGENDLSDMGRFLRLAFRLWDVTDYVIGFLSSETDGCIFDESNPQAWDKELVLIVGASRTRPIAGFCDVVRYGGEIAVSDVKWLVNGLDCDMRGAVFDLMPPENKEPVSSDFIDKVYRDYPVMELEKYIL